jgi:hypothetical protein
MLTKADIQQAIADGIENYPAVAALYKAGDPRIIQHLDAMATMLAMLSVNIEVAQAEPFEKVRDSTVLADAAMRGIIRKARSGRVSVLAKNHNASPFAVETGRTLYDSVGNSYRIETNATVPAGAIATFEALQVKTETITHTVVGSEPYYAILIPEADDGSYLTGISVSDVDGAYEYRERYVNTSPGEKVFNVEADDRQNIYVRFGHDGIVGVQPPGGAQVTLVITRAVGEIAPELGSPFSFDYIASPADANVELTLNSVLDTGQDPPDMATVRELIKYPAVYDHNAVFLGEFEFLVRKNYSNAQFISIWNELIEETAREASVDNINTLFVAVLSAGGSESVLTEPDPAVPVPPSLIAEGSWTATQAAIRALIKNADDSYRVKFYTPVRSEIAMTINATVSTSYVASDVQAQIRETVLDAYGAASAAARRGGHKPLYKDVYALLRKRVPAVADLNADMQVIIAQPVGAYRPELWRYVSPTSLAVTVATENLVSPSWG